MGVSNFWKNLKIDQFDTQNCHFYNIWDHFWILYKCKYFFIPYLLKWFASYWNNIPKWIHIVCDFVKVKFIYFEKATKFGNISTLLLNGNPKDKNKAEISQTLWPSQNIWTLIDSQEGKPLTCSVRALTAALLPGTR